MLYVADWRSSAIVEIEHFHRESLWRRLAFPWPVSTLSEPAGLAIYPDGRLLIADRGNHRIVVWSRDAVPPTVLTSDTDPIGALWHPGGVAVGPAGSLLIADTGNRRIVHCESLEEPTWSAFGKAGQGPGEFVSPTSVAADAMGRIVIADPGAGRLVRIDGMDGTGWTELTLPESRFLARPYGLTAPLGGILIADPGTRRILLLSTDEEGGDQCTVLIDGTEENTLLQAPTVAIEFDGSLYIADPAGASLALFHPEEDAVHWTLADRLYGELEAFPSPLFPRIGGFTAAGAIV